MTFLELVQKASLRADPLVAAPTTTVSQVGKALAFVNWVNDAWMDIQHKHPDWLFMRSSFTVNTTSGNGNYLFSACTDVATAVAIAAFRSWHKETLKIYLTSGGVSGERTLPYIPYKSWYSVYNTNTQTNNTPVLFTIANDRSLNLAPKPNGIFTVTGEYQKSATLLSGNSATPSLPTEYHDAIVYRALMFYSMSEETSFMYQTAETEYKRLVGRMTLSQLPEIDMADPLT